MTEEKNNKKTANIEENELADLKSKNENNESQNDLPNQEIANYQNTSSWAEWTDDPFKTLEWSKNICYSKEFPKTKTIQWSKNISFTKNVDNESANAKNLENIETQEQETNN